MGKPSRRCEQPLRGEPLLDGLFRRAGLDRKAAEWRVLALWPRVAGPRIGKHTRAERLLNGSLLVRARSASWANDLGFMRTELLERLRAAPGGGRIEDLRFTIGPLEELPAFDDETPRWLPPPPPTAEALPPVDDGQVAAALLQVKDPELRGALAELFARARARR
jgi:hypothetical protein